MCVKCNKIFINNFRNFRNFRNCQCKQGVTNIIFTVFQSGWTVLEEKILKINRGNVEARAQWLSEILLHLGEKARWLLLQDVFNEIHSCRHFTPWKEISSLRVVSLCSTAKFNSPVLVCSLKVVSLFSTSNFNTYSPVQTAQRSSHVVDRSSHDRSTISATATSKFTTTTASPAEQLIADIVTLFVRSKLWDFLNKLTLIYFLNGRFFQLAVSSFSKFSHVS